MTKLKLLALGVGLASCVAANAGEVTISPLFGWHQYDHGQMPDGYAVDDAKQFTGAIGYRFTPNWAVEGSMGRSRTSVRDNTALPAYTDNDVRWKHADLNALYRFNPDGSLQPFVLAGAGRTSADEDGQEVTNEDFGQVGVGAIWALTKGFGLRTEVRGLFTPNTNDMEYVGLVGAQLAFGGFDDDAPAPVKRAAEPEPAPVAEPVAEPAPAAPADADQDGVTDDLDKCPGTAAGTQVGADGCPVKVEPVAPADADKDGVPDSADKCPDTKAGAAVDATGCYEMLKEQVAIEIDVKFATGKADIQGDASAEVQKVVDFMKKYPEVKVTIEGHTDNKGNEAKNKALSQQRADAVKAEVVKAGVDAARLNAVGFGSSKPVADNKTEEGRAKNRRVVASAKAEAKTIKMKK